MIMTTLDAKFNNLPNISLSAPQKERDLTKYNPNISSSRLTVYRPNDRPSWVNITAQTTQFSLHRSPYQENAIRFRKLSKNFQDLTQTEQLKQCHRRKQ